MVRYFGFILIVLLCILNPAYALNPIVGVGFGLTIK